MTLPQAGFAGIRALAKERSGIHNITGIAETRASLVSGLLLEDRKGPSLVVVPSPGRAEKLGEDFAFFGGKRVYVAPEDEGRFLRFDAKSHQILEARLAVLSALVREEDCVVVASAAAALKYLPPKERFRSRAVVFETGKDYEREAIVRGLVAMGYERIQGTVEARGQFSFRGDILDVFPANQKGPRRIEFFDTEVDSIRIFDAETQRSVRTLERCEIYPAQLALLTEEEMEKAEPGMNPQMLERYLPLLLPETAFLWDYLPDGCPVVIEDPSRIREVLAFAEKEYREDFKARLERGEVRPEEIRCYAQPEAFGALYRKASPVFLLQPFERAVPEADRLASLTNLASKQPPVYNGRMDLFETDLKSYVKKKYTVDIALGSDGREENMRSFLDTIGLAEKIRTVTGQLSQGAEFPGEKYILFSDRDIFSNIRYARAKKETKHAKPIKAFTDIRKGDYVVHEVHGIGRFLGVEPLDVQGARKDYLKISYAGEDILYVPVEQMDVVQKYIGGGDGAPRVSRLGGQEWTKTKAKVKAAVESMTRELLELSAHRKLEKGFAFPEDTVWQREFEDRFPFEETPDQLRAVREIKRDMERPVAMERLLCGDVGYGKTEVAARAVFKAVSAGKQAAILVPTTILANQHYLTFTERFDGFPFRVDVLSRFRTDAEQAKTVRDLAEGKVDVLIGTHRMLSKDVVFKDLGLLVIDEEQRFGVQHKEAIKMLRKNVDVLTLSATPIPRTLHMSLVGIRDMSLIEEPPEERYPVQTYVLEQDNALLAEAIRREIGRGGQVYVVYNRVRGIQRVAAGIREIVPEATVSYAHGQMNETELENTMMDFMNGRFDVLVSTTIIESGLDIPNVNTIIVLDSDRFGLAQLYQLRGRVGRSNRMAYAYLMVQKDKALSEVAEKRLRAIREFTEFGSGFRIAMRDLEIRGAGDLLGTEQSGHMMMIGYELYCKLVDDAVKRLTAGGLVPDAAEEEQETSIELDLPAFLPEYYIEDEIARLSAYKRIAEIRTEEDERDVTDELIDRYGDLPEEAVTLMKIARLKSAAADVGCTRVRKAAGRLLFDFAAKSSLTPERIIRIMDRFGNRLLVRGGIRPSLEVAAGRETDVVKDAFDLLNIVKNP
jgi:transcription-repair coupling factor (superfamily II helicase)